MSILVLDHHGIGDVVISLPLLDSLCANFVGEPIDVVVKSGVEADIVQTTGVRRTIPFHRERMSLWDHARFIGSLVGRYRLLVATVNTNARLANRLGRVALIRERVGHGDTGGPFTINVSKRHVHKVDDNLEIARSLGIDPVDRTPRLRLPPGTSARATDPASERPLVVIHLGTGVLVGSRRFDTSVAHYKELPLSFWVQLLTDVEAAHGPVVWVSVGADRERVLLSQLKPRLKASMDIRDMAGRLSILETAAIIKESRLFVGGDSGLSHVAAAVGTTVVAMYGPTDPSVTGPIGDRVEVMTSDSCTLSPCYPDRIYECSWSRPDAAYSGSDTRMCMSEFTPKSVARRIERYLG